MLVKLLTTRAKRAVKDSLTFALPKVKIRVNQGIVRGVVEKLPNGRPFQRFSGIPFAQPPVNELRFRSPQKLLKFDQDEIDCTRERDPSFHKSSIWRKYLGSEDCLNLNVYVPPNATATNKVPVMVFIHGGGLVFDSNSRDFYSPEYLLQEDVIVVTINYRLHALGFLSLPTMGISGNAGLKDQQMALEWVHENIANFNGNPDKICLFGESAGGACVHLHAMNPKSSKFFKSAICQSNYATADWLFQKDGEDKARRLAKLLGSSEASDKDVLNVLMKAPLQQIYDNNIKAVDFNSDEMRRNLPFVFKPVIEKESEDSFITMSPAELLKHPSTRINIPMIFGLNNGDGMTMGSYYRNKKLHLFDNDYMRLVPISLNIDPESDEAKKVAIEIKQFYFGDKPIDEKSIKEFCAHMTDFQFTIAQITTNELHARFQPQSKQFAYEFRYDGELNIFKQLLKMTDVPGACHFDEIFYLFDAKLTGAEVARTSEAWKMREMMCKMWTNFAKYHDPTPDDSLPFKWTPINPATPDTKALEIDYLKIDKHTEMQKSLYKERVDFWRNLYDKYNSGFINPKF